MAATALPWPACSAAIEDRFSTCVTLGGGGGGGGKSSYRKWGDEAELCTDALGERKCSKKKKAPLRQPEGTFQKRCGPSVMLSGHKAASQWSEWNFSRCWSQSGEGEAGFPTCSGWMGGWGNEWMNERCDLKVHSFFFPDSRLFLTCSHQKTKWVSWNEDGWQSRAHASPKHLEASSRQHGGDGGANSRSSTTTHTYVSIWKTHLSLRRVISWWADLHDERLPLQSLSPH